MDTVARFGGDEFVVLLGELGVKQPESIGQTNTVAEKIRAILSETYLLKTPGTASVQLEKFYTSSIAAVLFNNHESRADEILKNADIVMYQAKNERRNIVGLFDPDVSAACSH